MSQSLEPCWWMDRNDCWEITHHATRADAEHRHADRVRREYGFPLSVAGALGIVPAEAVREPQPCHEAVCVECGTVSHVQTRQAECVECDSPIITSEIAIDDPKQSRIFEVLPTHDLDGSPLSRVVLFEE